MRRTLIRLPKEEHLDPWDPNNWEEDDHECRIYGCEDLSVYAVVDAIYYPYLSQFKWSIHVRKRVLHPYLRRSISVFSGPDGSRYESRVTGKLVRNRQRVQYTRFLHVEVLMLAGVSKPTPAHKEGDHISRDVVDCRLDNLRWATRAEQIQNSKWNRNGNHVYRSTGGNVLQGGPDRHGRGDGSVPTLPLDDENDRG